MGRVVLQRVQLHEQQRRRVDPSEGVDDGGESRVLGVAQRLAVVALLWLGCEDDQAPVERDPEFVAHVGSIEVAHSHEQVVEIRLAGHPQRLGGTACVHERVAGDGIHHRDRIGQRVEAARAG